MRMRHFLLCLCLAVPGLATAITVGSKAFTESYILAELAKDILTQSGGGEVTHKVGMGKTLILWQALSSGGIDVYPEYTGTIAKEILKLNGPWTDDILRDRLKLLGIGMTHELGFNNTYSLVMRKDIAARFNIHSISDLKKNPDLPVGATLEFLGRNDGWKPLSERYGLQMNSVKGIEHMLGYEAMRTGSIAIKDAYSTDAAIAENDLVVLQDDLDFFPSYRAVYLYRLSLPAADVEKLNQVAGKIDGPTMTKFNAEAEQTKDFVVAAHHLEAAIGLAAPSPAGATSETGHSASWLDMWPFLLQHLELVSISMVFAVLIGLPLGIFAARQTWLGRALLSVTGLIQTVPSLALFAILVPWLGTEPRTAILALFLYSLLPIVRNTAIGLSTIPPSLRESATALGLHRWASLRKVELPMASPTILAGIKTSAIINVGSATIAAFIGAGGLGQPIQTGLSLSDNALILKGAVSAAVLALVVQGAFDLLERYVVPKGLRLRSQ